MHLPSANHRFCIHRIYYQDSPTPRATYTLYARSRNPARGVSPVADDAVCHAGRTVRTLTVEDADGVPTAGEPGDDGGPDTARAAGHKDPEVGHFALSTLEARWRGYVTTAGFVATGAVQWWLLLRSGILGAV